MPAGDELERVLDAAVELTRYEAEGAYSLSIARHNTIRPSAIWDPPVGEAPRCAPSGHSWAECFDGVFFIDPATSDEKHRIWQLYRELCAIPESQTRPDDTSWTGAEIRSCCRLAALLDVPLTQAAHNVVPVAVTASASVERLRGWATGRSLSASQPGVYSRAGTPAPKPSRRVVRGDSSN